MAKTPRVQQILNLPIVDVNKMTAAELRKNVQILASAANKRLARLGATEIGKIAPAYLSAEKRSFTGAAGGKFGTAGKNRNQLLNEFKAAKSFLEMKTSSVAGWKKLRTESYKRAGLPRMDDAAKEAAFWKAYRKIEELYPNIKSMQYGSDETQTDLRKVMFGDTQKELLAEINAYNLRDRKAVLDEDENTVDIDELFDRDGDFVVDGDGKVWDINFDDPDDILRIMELKVQMEYEREEYSAEDDEFFEL